MSALDEGSTSANPNDAPVSRIMKENPHQFFDLLITDIEVGRSNDLLQAVRTFSQQVAYTRADIEIEGLDPMLSGINSMYIADRWKRCQAVDQSKRALIDYLSGGYGWAHMCLRDGYPVMEMVDTLRMVWDLTASIPALVEWAAVALDLPLWKWRKLFGEEGFLDLKNASKDSPVEVTFYFDLGAGDGEGTFCAWRTSNGEPVQEEPVKVGKNPYHMGGKAVLPFRSMYYFSMPSVIFPVSVAELALPNQIAVWEGEKVAKDIIGRGSPFYEVEENAMDEDQRQRFEDGDIAAIVERKAGTGPVISHPAMEIPQSLDYWIQQNRKAIIGLTGMDPYANGQRVEGIKFAAESNAIQEIGRAHV